MHLYTHPFLILTESHTGELGDRFMIGVQANWGHSSVTFCAPEAGQVPGMWESGAHAAPALVQCLHWLSPLSRAVELQGQYGVWALLGGSSANCQPSQLCRHSFNHGVTLGNFSSL